MVSGRVRDVCVLSQRAKALSFLLVDHLTSTFDMDDTHTGLSPQEWAARPSLAFALSSAQTGRWVPSLPQVRAVNDRVFGGTAWGSGITHAV